MIKDSVLKEIIKDYLERPLPELVERELNVPIDVKIKRAISIIGPRRAGKTYFMFQIMKNVDEERRLYINFEDYRLEGADYRDFARLVEFYYHLFPENKRKKVFFFFDEVQNIEGWEKVIRHLLDNENCQIFITGSSSKLLSKEIATQLRGRTLTYTLLPFSFREFLRAKGFGSKRFFSSYEKAKVINYLEEYLKKGGFPEVVLFKEGERILDEIWEVTVARDIIERWEIRNVKVLRLLIRALKESKQFSTHKFHKYLKSLGIKASKNTLYSYLEYLKDAFAVFTVHRYSLSYKDMEKSVPKIYLADNGLYFESWNMSRAMENAVFLEMYKQYREVYYYVTKNGKEIDFYIPEERVLIEVAHDPDIEHEKKMAKAMNELGAKQGIMITWDYEDEKEISLVNKRVKIKFVPLWKWLLLKQ